MYPQAHSKTALLFAFLCAFMFALLTPAYAQNSVEENVAIVQAHFHFKDPKTGGDLNAGDLQTVLLLSNGKTDYLNQGVSLCTLMDSQQDFANNHYFKYTQNLKTMLSSALNLPDWKSGLAEIARDWFLENDFLYASSAFASLDAYFVATGAWETINAFVEAYEILLIDELVRDYISYVIDPNDDASDWEDLRGEWEGIQNRNDFHIDLHTFCRFNYDQNKKLSTLQPDLDKYAAAVNGVIRGAAVIGYKEGRYAYYAPCVVTFDASQSTGSLGSDVNGHKWYLDGKFIGRGVTLEYTFWTAGTYTVELHVFDTNLKELVATDTLTIGTPPIDIAQEPTTSSVPSPHRKTTLSITTNGSSATVRRPRRGPT